MAFDELTTTVCPHSLDALLKLAFDEPEEPTNALRGLRLLCDEVEPVVAGAFVNQGQEVPVVSNH
jgi:hypothetical protein